MARRPEGFNLLERLLLIAGVTLLAIVAVALVHRSVASRAALREFDMAQARAAQSDASPAPRTQLDLGDAKRDFSLWSEKRIRGYKESLAALNSPPMGVLSLARLDIRVPLFEGTSDLVLNRGVGWIPGTARPGESGNVGIAGHRDGFFRGLKDVARGDVIELATTREKFVYEVDEIKIVAPNNVGVLRPRGKPSLTIVTCYPFYFIGDAPKRFIVHAELNGRAGAKKSETGSAVRRTMQFDN